MRAMAIAIMTRVWMVIRSNNGGGEHYRFMQLEREREIKHNLVGISKYEGAMVVLLAHRQDGKGEIGLFAYPQ